MEITPSTLRLKLKAIQKNLSKISRFLMDSKYRDFLNNGVLFEEMLSHTYQIEGNLASDTLKGWTPVRLELSQEPNKVAWLNLDKTSFTDAFARYTVRRSWQEQNRPKAVWTELDALIALKDNSSSLKPKGFIVHTGKCGSTLLSKMLCSTPRNLMISEDIVMQQALLVNNWSTDANFFSETSRIELLQSVINAFGQKRLGTEENYLIEFAPKCILKLPLIRKVFPDVPLVFLYRNPIEVIVSNLISPLSYMKTKKKDPEACRRILNISALEMTRLNHEYPNLVVRKLLDWSATDIARMSDEEFLARNLGLYFRFIIQYLDENVLVIEYNQLKSKSCLKNLHDFFHVKVSEEELLHMLSQQRFYSKEDVQKIQYTDDSLRKQKMASKKLHKAVDKWLMEDYLEIEKIKCSC